MARKPRGKSSSGIYHVMFRGINKQIVFEDDDDRFNFLATLKKYKMISGYTIYGYCIMDNHVHLLIKESAEENLSKAIQRISSSFVLWYNKKYDRTGHLFQGRFKSVNIEDERAFLTVLRYIHQNPLKAGLTTNVFTSKWTSIVDYLYGSTLVSVDYAFKLFSSNKDNAYYLFNEYMQLSDDTYTCLNFATINRAKDAELIELLKRKGIVQLSELKKLDKEQRNKIIIELKNMNGVSTRQLSRITGIPKTTISRIH
ncbi:Transposase IS200 like protein [Paraliobacillus sp. PM-2]|uniref:transposase n=1 Tax=Paraliobacillus sp. PM-2 TaxID=1462524 RepID=UPI00061C8885|nr:transposase [Paraliobacillus sp. PM-2]CQR46298.1 Transposase IS200 like protein [Paraliobacillus sp. PM-2]